MIIRGEAREGVEGEGGGGGGVRYPDLIIWRWFIEMISTVFTYCP